MRINWLMVIAIIVIVVCLAYLTIKRRQRMQ
jgi:hypothetical protein